MGGVEETGMRRKEGEGVTVFPYLAFVLQMSWDSCCSSSREARGEKH